VCMDAFIVSHTSMEIEMATQEQADRFLPPCRIPHHVDTSRPFTTGGMTLPQDTLSHRLELDEAMKRVPAVLEEHRQSFHEIFGRRVSGAVTAYRTEDADSILVASGTIATTARDVVDACRAKGERIGLLQIKMFRPFPTEEVVGACAGARRIGVIDRNYAAGIGGIFCHDLRAALQARGGQLVQGYLAGVGGGDVVPGLVQQVVADLTQRDRAGEPVWMGIES